MTEWKKGLLALLTVAGIALLLEVIFLSVMNTKPSGYGFFYYFCIFFVGLLCLGNR